MFIWPGIQLFGHVTAEKKGVRNGVLYSVERIEDDKVYLDGNSHGFTLDQVKSWLRLSYAQTYASCQGTEYNDSLCLHDSSHQFFTKRHLFVGLSRAKEGAFINIKE